MARKNDPEDTIKVSEVPSRKGIAVGKPRPIMTAAMRSKVAYPMSGSTTLGAGGNFYSPELSTDFLELPQSVDEQRNFFRFFYNNDPFVGQAIDIHVELPLSKLRIALPKARSRDMAEQSLRYCERWVKRIGLLQRLMEIVHEYYLIGEVFIFLEDTSPDMPRDIRAQSIREITPDGEVLEKWEEYPDADDREVKWLKRNYTGWTAVRVLPPEQIKMESFNFTDEKLMELIPDSKTRGIIEKARQGDIHAQRVVESMPEDIVNAIVSGDKLPLNTDPDAGSFVYYLARKRSPYEPRGNSILQRCLRILVFRDKVRQSLASIASRHMTPYRLVSAENMNDEQTEALREQVDLALADPDYSVITNFPVEWNEIGAADRLPDWSWVFEFTDRQMYAGLGVTESLLSGESSYSGDRIHLEVVNTRYMLLREMLQTMVEDKFFEPMCRRMGFVEEDEDGNLEVVVPRLSFTRLALRDSADTFEALFNLYQKGSLDVDTILDLLNLDPVAVREKLERDFATFNDPSFNEVLRGIYSKVGDQLVDTTEITEKIAKNLGLKYKPPADAGRF